MKETFLEILYKEVCPKEEELARSELEEQSRQRQPKKDRSIKDLQ